MEKNILLGKQLNNGEYKKADLLSTTLEYTTVPIKMSSPPSIWGKTAFGGELVFVKNQTG